MKNSFEYNDLLIATKMINPIDNRLTNRIIYFDYLRVIAMFAVMILHISAQNWYSTDVNGFEWQVFNFYDSISRCGVPLFVMISGAIFLNRDIPIHLIYKKYIKRMFLAYMLWSFLYSIINKGHISLSFSPTKILKGHYHMWFIWMIIGLYICLPVLKSIIKSEERTKYYLLLSIVFAYIIPQILTLINDFGNESIINIANTINDGITKMDIHIALGYSGYFVLGYYINRTDFEKKQRIIIYVLGLLGISFTIIVDLIVAIKTQTHCGNYYGNFNMNVLLESLAIFVLLKYVNYNSHRLNCVFYQLSRYCFGAYLVHALIIELLDTRIGLNTLSFNPIYSVLSIGLITLIASFGLSGIINHIPYINRYFV